MEPPEVTIARVKTLDAQLNDSLATERFETLVRASFGAAGLLLAMLGIYGVMSYSVVTGKQEISVRMALGAGRRVAVSTPAPMRSRSPVANTNSSTASAVRSCRRALFSTKANRTGPSAFSWSRLRQA
jgi:hypothetical protein